jgi:hypothetical protein
MSDNLKGSGGQDRSRIDVSQEWELRYWTDKFGITPEDLKQAVRQVGDRVEDVERKIGARAGKR